MIDWPGPLTGRMRGFYGKNAVDWPFCVMEPGDFFYAKIGQRTVSSLERLLKRRGEELGMTFRARQSGLQVCVHRTLLLDEVMS